MSEITRATVDPDGMTIIELTTPGTERTPVLLPLHLTQDHEVEARVMVPILELDATAVLKQTEQHADDSLVDIHYIFRRPTPGDTIEVIAIVDGYFQQLTE